MGMGSAGEAKKLTTILRGVDLRGRGPGSLGVLLLGGNKKGTYSPLKPEDKE